MATSEWPCDPQRRPEVRLSGGWRKEAQKGTKEGWSEALKNEEKLGESGCGLWMGDSMPAHQLTGGQPPCGGPEQSQSDSPPGLQDKILRAPLHDSVPSQGPGPSGRVLWQRPPEWSRLPGAAWRKPGLQPAELWRR